MLPKTSIVAGQSDGIINVEHSTTYSIDEISSPRLHSQIVQNILLIWLDQNIDNSNTDCCNTIRQLRCAINSIHTFTDSNECMEFLQRMDTENVCIIISGLLGQHMVPQVHNMSQVDSIFIFSSNQEYHEQWVHQWSKIKGVFTEISPICEALKKAADQCEQNAISISFLTTVNDLKQNLDQLEPSFMYIQIMKEILLDIDFEEKHVQQYIHYCRTVFADNDSELRKITRFEQEYRDKTAIGWYTFECFLYPMVNRAARLIDVDIIIKMGFFIKDLHRHIEELHQEQFHSAQAIDKFLVYRGQGMVKTEFEQMTKTQGGLVSFNNFLSTSKNQSVSLRFANRVLTNPDVMGVLFTMSIDPSQSTTPFASIKDVSYFKGEDEVLFAMQTVFRIGNITPIGENPRLFQVELTLTSNKDKDLRQLTEYIRSETTKLGKGWYGLGTVLDRMGQFKKAEEVYQTLLEQKTTETKKAPIYYHIGLAKEGLGEYNQAIKFYEKAVEIFEKDLSSNNHSLSSVYSGIGNVYKNVGEYSKALSYYKKSLDIDQQSLPPNHPHLAISYNNIGDVYDNMGEYGEALSYYERSLKILQQSLPPNHPHLAISYNNIGSVYNNMGVYSKALWYHERSLEIRQQSLPSNHSGLAVSYNSMGTLYGRIGEDAKALPYFEKALEIWQQSLSPNHPHLAASYMNLGVIYKHMGEYSKALSYCEKSLEIEQQSLPPDYPHLADINYNLGSIHKRMGNYSKALSCLESALTMGERSLPSNHPYLRDYRTALEKLKKNL